MKLSKMLKKVLNTVKINGTLVVSGTDASLDIVLDMIGTGKIVVDDLMLLSILSDNNLSTMGKYLKLDKML